MSLPRVFVCFLSGEGDGETMGSAREEGITVTGATMEFRITDTFTGSLARLTGDEQKAVKTTALDLQLDPANPAMSFHKLGKANVSRSCRIAPMWTPETPWKRRVACITCGLLFHLRFLAQPGIPWPGVTSTPGSGSPPGVG